MAIDPTIQAQTYPYFLQEAPELLRTLEQDLLHLRQESSIHTIHNLMRTTHTLKGAAASVGLETIAYIAHALEDIFSALCRPGISLAPDVVALLFAAYECLSLSLARELSDNSIDNNEIRNRATIVFAQLRETLGQDLEPGRPLPTSAELGFDVVQSMFEVGVTQRLNQLENAIAEASPQELAVLLRTQAEVFLGLAESLNLPGFGEIATATIAALDHHPEQVLAIAHQTLASFRVGQAAVLAGDRSQGGQPSTGLRQLATARGNLANQSSNHRTTAISPSQPDPESRHEMINRSPRSSQPVTPQISANGDKKTKSFLHWFRRLRGTEIENPAPVLPPPLSASSSPSQHSQKGSSETNLLESLWGQPILDADSESENPLITRVVANSEVKQDPINALVLQRQYPDQSANSAIPQNSFQQKRNSRSTGSTTVRVNLEHLDQLNNAIGEILTYQNRQLLQNEQLQANVHILLKRLQQHHQQLNQLQDPDRSANATTLSSIQPEGFDPSGFVPFPLASDRFDTLELDRYSSSQLLVQSLLDDTIQLAEVADAIELFAQQSNQALEKQRLLLTHARDALLAARMLPLGEVFSRLSPVLQQLETLHHKPVDLELCGSEVLVDKAIAEKLYDPLLHLLRNAFDHGIESIPVRRQWGKPEQGQLAIQARHQGRYLMIDVRDDGAGLDFQHIRQIAISSKLLTPEQADHLDQTQLIDLLFTPGFSTTAEVNTLSGRGIGLDVVRSQIQALQGSIIVQSELHRGTTFTLQIPLGLTIAKLLICQVGDRIYAFLAESIQQILLPHPEQIQTRDGRRILWWGTDLEEQPIPLSSFTDVIHYNASIPSLSVHPKSSSESTKCVLLIRCLDSLWGLEVDQLPSEQELVIRPLGRLINSPNYIQGASILADGQLTLVLDAASLLEQKVLQLRHLAHHPGVESNMAQPFPLFESQPQGQLPARHHLIQNSDHPTNVSTTESRDCQILIVDDSITTRQTLALTLQKAGYRVLQAKDGYEAIEQLQHHPQIRLVICDLEMPRMNGFELLSHCQRDPVLAALPIMILTSRSSDKHRSLALQLGAAAYVTKPYIENKLLEIVAEKLVCEK